MPSPVTTRTDRGERGRPVRLVIYALCSLAGLLLVGSWPAGDGPGFHPPKSPMVVTVARAAQADTASTAANESPADTAGINLDPIAESPGPIFRLPIEGIIDLGLAPFVERVIEQADQEGASALLLDIDTFGGRVDAAVKIRDALLDAPMRTIAFIHPRAISAGALISLACETIVMAPGGSIGAATPVTAGKDGMEAADEKVTSYMRAEMRATAERRGRPADIAEAMVDADIEIEDVTEEGKLLTLTTDEALRLGIADFEAGSVSELVEKLDLADAAIIDSGINWAERIARGISHPVLSSFLLSIGFLGILIELYQPGWGIPGTLGIICLLVFFLGHYVVNLAGMEEILLFLAGLVLLVVEFFIIPGFGIAGILGAAALLASVVLSLVGLDWQVSWELGLVHEAMMVVSSSILGLALGAFLFFRLAPRMRIARPFVLQRGLTAREGFTSHKVELAARFPAGATGVALSDLRPAGKIRLGGQRLDAMTEGGYLDRDARVIVLAWRGGTAVVGAAPATADTGAPPPRPENRVEDQAEDQTEDQTGDRE